MTADPVAAYVAGREFRMLIDGEFADAGQAAVREVIDPSTGRVVGEVPEASPADVTAAVAAAGAAQPGWQALGVDGRAECFRRFGELLSERREELAMLDALDSGNPHRHRLVQAVSGRLAAAGPLAVRRGDPRQPRPPALHDVPAVRGRGTDHRVQPSGDVRRDAAAAGADYRQHGGAQAGSAGIALLAGACAAVR